MSVKFNSQQQIAIDFYKGNCLVMAAAGSGKSTILVNRIKNLVNTHNVNQEDILAISFTRNTADELKAKLTKINIPYVNTGTFHSICGRILSMEGIHINGQNLIKDWQVESCFKAIQDNPDVNDIKGYISYQKNYMRGVHDEFVSKDSNYHVDDLRQFYIAYEKYKKKHKLYDFDDYLLLTYHILKENKGKYTFEFILVDEHQDSNLIQSKLLEEFNQSGNLFCVGDVRQGIYGFRGSDPAYFMNFDKDWEDATILHVDTNYRSTKNIVENANHFIKKYYGDFKHYSDSIAANQNNGNITIRVFEDDKQEAWKVANDIEKLIVNGESLNEIAVLYRVNSQAIHIENELKKRDIDYEISGDSSFFKRREISGILSYLRLIHNPHDDAAFESIFNLRNYPLQFFSGKLLGDIKRNAGLKDLSLYESFISYNYTQAWQRKNARIFEDNIEKLRLQNDKLIHVTKLIDNVIRVFQFEGYIQDKYPNKEEADERIKSMEVLKSFVKNNNLEQFITYVYSGNTKKKAKKNSVKLMSIHASKGLEYTHTYLIGMEEGKFPHEKADHLEETRLFYVGCTRSKQNLHISQIGEYNKFVDEYFNNK